MYIMKKPSNVGRVCPSNASNNPSRSSIRTLKSSSSSNQTPKAMVNKTNIAPKKKLQKSFISLSTSKASNSIDTINKGIQNNECKNISRLTALEEFFPKDVLNEIGNSTVPTALKEEQYQFYNLLVASLYATDNVDQKSPEEMNAEQMEELMKKTQLDMKEIEEMLRAKERECARLMRWWEVKHDMLTFLFKCKSKRDDGLLLHADDVLTSSC